MLIASLEIDEILASCDVCKCCNEDVARVYQLVVFNKEAELSWILLVTSTATINKSSELKSEVALDFMDIILLIYLVKVFIIFDNEWYKLISGNKEFYIEKPKEAKKIKVK